MTNEGKKKKLMMKKNIKWKKNMIINTITYNINKKYELNIDYYYHCCCFSVH